MHAQLFDTTVLGDSARPSIIILGISVFGRRFFDCFVGFGPGSVLDLVYAVLSATVGF